MSVFERLQTWVARKRGKHGEPHWREYECSTYEGRWYTSLEQRRRVARKQLHRCIANVRSHYAWNEGAVYMDEDGKNLTERLRVPIWQDLDECARLAWHQGFDYRDSEFSNSYHILYNWTTAAKGVNNVAFFNAFDEVLDGSFPGSEKQLDNLERDDHWVSDQSESEVIVADEDSSL